MRRMIALLGVLWLLLGTAGCIAVTEEEQTDELCAAIITALEQQDEEKIKALFSERALSEADDFADGCRYLFELYHGEKCSAERIRFSSDTSYDSGRHSREIDAEFEVATDEEHYFLYINWWQSDTLQPANQGLYSLKMVTLDTRNQTSDFDPGSRSKRAGIYHPDWADTLSGKAII